MQRQWTKNTQRGTEIQAKGKEKNRMLEEKMEVPASPWDIKNRHYA
jgi:hypothetical protein